MKVNRVNNKTITIVIITLFIVLTIAPNFTAQIKKSTSRNDLIEITISMDGISDLKSQKIKLTKQQINEIEESFDAIKTGIDNAHSKMKAVNIFCKGIAELNKYGLLPKDSSVKQVLQRFIYQNIFHYRTKNLLGNNLENQFINNDMNTNCLFIAKMNESRYLRNHVSNLFLFSFFYDYDILQKYFPLALGGTIFIGRNVTRGNFVFLYPSYGWISTFGINGKKNWSGPFYGNIWFNGYADAVQTVIFYSGVTNFVGLKLRYSEDGEKQFYLGFASEVAISSSVPQPS